MSRALWVCTRVAHQAVFGHLQADAAAGFPVPF
jgi:hypothetical protein